MSKWQIKLKNIGRNKVTRTIEIEAPGRFDAEDRARAECRKHLASRNIELTHEVDSTYTVNAGFHTVGEVQIVIA